MKVQPNGRQKITQLVFSCVVWCLANYLLPIEVSPRIATPLTSSQTSKLGQPRKAGYNVSTRLESVN